MKPATVFGNNQFATEDFSSDRCSTIGLVFSQSDSMNPIDFIIILTIIVVLLYWLSASKGKEIACWVGKEACKEIGVGFLDDTVALHRVWIGKNDNGEKKLFRRYRFEFTSDGSQRYKGEIVISDAKLIAIELEPYRVPPQEDRLH